MLFGMYNLDCISIISGYFNAGNHAKYMSDGMPKNISNEWHASWHISKYVFGMVQVSMPFGMLFTFLRLIKLA
jgi:hypothetical protein